MSKKISAFQLARAAEWVQHEVLDPWINETEATLAQASTMKSNGLISSLQAERRAELEVLMRLTKACQRLIEKEQGQ